MTKQAVAGDSGSSVLGVGAEAQSWLEEFAALLGRAEYRVAGRSVSAEDGLEAIGDVLQRTVDLDGSLWWSGNGGSAAVCTHLAQDALNLLGARSIAVMDAALLTRTANDEGYENVFSSPFSHLFRPGDALVALSSSGESENVVRAIELANRSAVSVISLSAFARDNRVCRLYSDVSVYLPSRSYGHAEIGHAAVLHAVIGAMASIRQA